MERGISSRIKIIRENLKLSQKELADRIGFSQSYVCGVENGIKCPGAKFILQISSVFGIKTMWLTDGIGEMFPAGSVSDFKPEQGFMIAERNSFRTAPESEGKSVPLPQNGGFTIFDVEEGNMEPLCTRGDRILVDPADNNPQNGGIYLFEINSRKTVKRCLGLGSHSLKLTNDRPATKNNDLFFDSSTKCLGKVIWVIRKIQ